MDDGQTTAGPSPHARLAPQVPLDPLTVSQPDAMVLLGIKHSQFFRMKRAKQFDCVKIGKREMVVFSSLRRLVEQPRTN